VRARRGTPELVVAALFILLLGWYVVYTNRVVRDLRRDAQRTSVILAQAIRGQADTSPLGRTAALLAVIDTVIQQGVPTIIISPDGELAASANVPRAGDPRLSRDDPRVKEYVARLEAENTPVMIEGVGTVYFGHSSLVRGLRVIPGLQALTGAVLLLGFIYIVRTRTAAARERLWAGMARESAHQLGTPLSSLAGWTELLEDRAAGDPSVGSAVQHMRGDLERLHRVAHRFERIGREPRYETLDPGAVVERVATYFRARVPTLANTVAIETDLAPSLPAVQGDAVLLEWALEVLMKNAIDALAGRGGTVRLSTAHTADDGVSIRVADDGPGIPSAMRRRVFEPGFSTKKTGWGIGLSLARRIVEENHGGRLSLLPTTSGATFEIILN
jgi:signal transduction histidine kinase